MRWPEPPKVYLNYWWNIVEIEVFPLWEGNVLKIPTYTWKFVHPGWRIGQEELAEDPLFVEGGWKQDVSSFCLSPCPISKMLS